MDARHLLLSLRDRGITIRAADGGGLQWDAPAGVVTERDIELIASLQDEIIAALPEFDQVYFVEGIGYSVATLPRDPNTPELDNLSDDDIGHALSLLRLVRRHGRVAFFPPFPPEFWKSSAHLLARGAVDFDSSPDGDPMPVMILIARGGSSA